MNKVLDCKITLTPKSVETSTISVSSAVSGSPHALACLLHSLIYFVDQGPINNQEMWDNAIDILDDKTKCYLKERVAMLYKSNEGESI